MMISSNARTKNGQEKPIQIGDLVGMIPSTNGNPTTIRRRDALLGIVVGEKRKIKNVETIPVIWIVGFSQVNKKVVNVVIGTLRKISD